MSGAIAHSWMQFVDGENLTIRTQKFLAESRIRLVDHSNFKRDCYVVPGDAAHRWISLGHKLDPTGPVRCYFYTSLVGDEPAIVAARESLWRLGYEPHVFKKTDKLLKAKGVDIALTKDMLSHAFRDNYDAAVLVAGDGDYVPLVEEVKRLGKRVHVRFFESVTNLELKLAADTFADIGPNLINWARAIPPQFREE